MDIADGSDITCTFPADGRYSSEQRLVYEAVLAAHTAVLKAMKPGIKWTVSSLLCLLIKPYFRPGVAPRSARSRDA